MACLGVMGHGIGRSPVRTLHEIHLGTEVVAHAVRANRALLDDRGIALAAEPPAGGVPVVANRDKIIQVLTNLLSNAAKFTPPRGGASRSGRSSRETRRWWRTPVPAGGGHAHREAGWGRARPAHQPRDRPAPRRQAQRHQCPRPGELLPHDPAPGACSGMTSEQCFPMTNGRWSPPGGSAQRPPWPGPARRFPLPAIDPPRLRWDIR